MEYMQTIKVCNNEILLINSTYDIEEHTLKFLSGLDDKYSPLVFAGNDLEPLFYLMSFMRRSPVHVSSLVETRLMLQSQFSYLMFNE